MKPVFTEKNQVIASASCLWETRIDPKFPLVFEENCNYGFRRNMYGMRLIGLSVASICATALGFSIYRLTSSHQFVPVISLVLEAANVVMIPCLAFLGERGSRPSRSRRLR